MRTGGSPGRRAARGGPGDPLRQSGQTITPEITKVKSHWNMPLKIHWTFPVQSTGKVPYDNNNSIIINDNENNNNNNDTTNNDNDNDCYYYCY